MPPGSPLERRVGENRSEGDDIHEGVRADPCREQIQRFVSFSHPKAFWGLKEKQKGHRECSRLFRRKRMHVVRTSRLHRAVVFCATGLRFSLDKEEFEKAVRLKHS